MNELEELKVGNDELRAKLIIEQSQLIAQLEEVEKLREEIDKSSHSLLDGYDKFSENIVSKQMELQKEYEKINKEYEFVVDIVGKAGVSRNNFEKFLMELLTDNELN